MSLAIVGSRRFVNYEHFKVGMAHALCEFNIIINNIVSGGARGADSLAERYARDNNIPIQIFRPYWDKFGKKAGILRNTDIINAATHVVAFVAKDSVGTLDSIRKAKEKGLPLFIIKID